MEGAALTKVRYYQALSCYGGGEVGGVRTFTVSCSALMVMGSYGVLCAGGGGDRLGLGFRRSF